MSTGFKDHFSTQSRQYQRYRPRYPAALFAWLAEQTPAHELAWDCATGNGQAAQALAMHFSRVIATDASENQIVQCTPQSNIEYQVASAERAPLNNDSVDLITVAQALHWFDHTAFFNEAWRVLKSNGVLVAWSYNLLSINPAVDAVVNHYYHDIVGPYWPQERKLVEQGYAPLPAPFREITVPAFAMYSQWNRDELLGYLGTWSASVYYAKAMQRDPLSLIQETIDEAWPDPEQTLKVHWPLHIRAGIKG